MATDPIDNTEDVIDSRNVIARLGELQRNDLDEDETEELAALLALQEACDTREWPHGLALIRDGYFETYAQELAEAVCGIKSLSDWPANHIDWKAATEALQIDYTQIDFNGEVYWHRS